MERTVYKPIVHGEEWHRAYVTREQAEEVMGRYYNATEYLIREETLTIDEDLMTARPLLDLLEEEQKCLHRYQYYANDTTTWIDTKYLQKGKEEVLMARKAIREYLIDILGREI